MSGIKDIDETHCDSELFKKANETNEMDEIDPIDECKLLVDTFQFYSSEISKRFHRMCVCVFFFQC